MKTIYPVAIQRTTRGVIMQICGVYLGKTKEIYPDLLSAIDKQADLAVPWLDNLGLRGDG